MTAMQSIHWTMLLFILVPVSAQSQMAVNLRGKVTTASGIAISGAEVTLVGLHLKDTTDSQGHFEMTSIATSLFSAQRTVSPRERSILLHRSRNPWTETRFEPGIGFDLRGRFWGGAWIRDPRGDSKSEIQANNQTLGYGAGTLAKKNTLIDTLQVVATGYKTISKAIESYAGEVDIALPDSLKTCRELGRDLRNRYGGDQPIYQVLYPNGGEVYVTGQQLQIKVIGADDEKAALIHIRFIDAEGITHSALWPGQTESFNLHETCEFATTLPDSIFVGSKKVSLISNQVKIRVSDYTLPNLRDESDTPFSIKAP